MSLRNMVVATGRRLGKTEALRRATETLKRAGVPVMIAEPMSREPAAHKEPGAPEVSSAVPRGQLRAWIERSTADGFVIEARSLAGGIALRRHRIQDGMAVGGDLAWIAVDADEFAALDRYLVTNSDMTRIVGIRAEDHPLHRPKPQRPALSGEGW